MVCILPFSYLLPKLFEWAKIGKFYSFIKVIFIVKIQLNIYKNEKIYVWENISKVRFYKNAPNVDILVKDVRKIKMLFWHFIKALLWFEWPFLKFKQTNKPYCREPGERRPRLVSIHWSRAQGWDIWWPSGRLCSSWCKPHFYQSDCSDWPMAPKNVTINLIQNQKTNSGK